MTATGTSPTGTILVVDDQPANLRAMNALLSRAGYTVLTASDAAQALALASQSTPDLILLDMMMPGVNGFELLALIKQDPALLRLPVVFLTAAQDREMLLRAFDAGAVDYVTKPFMPEELLARVNAHIGLKLTRDRLERVARERQQLVNLVAHDLKNPLSSVLFASDMLLSDECKPERVPRYLQIIHESAGDAIGYIRHYLETQVRAHSDTCTSAQVPACSLRDTMQWLVDRYEMQVEAHGMRLSALLPPEDACVAIDGMVLRQVTENLISNAIKYAAHGGVLELASHGGAPGYWRLLVADRGQGIAAHKQHDLFKPFVRLDDVDPADGLSSGLGLSLAKQIVSAAGGQLWYENREGGGACFVIELPQARTLPASKTEDHAQPIQPGNS